jgi:hypothetical protein
MTLDCTFNKDLNVSNRIHVIDTLHDLPEEDNRNFSLSTPNWCSERICRPRGIIYLLLVRMAKTNMKKEFPVDNR